MKKRRGEKWTEKEGKGFEGPPIRPSGYTTRQWNGEALGTEYC